MPMKYNTIENHVNTIYGCFQKFPLLAFGLPRCYPERKSKISRELEWPRITKRVVDGLKPDRRDFVKCDSELTGFGVRVRPSGAKSFVAVYRTGGRNSPLVTIGAVGKIESERLVKAHAKIIAGAELGQDHAAERAKARADLTVTELCALYLAEGCETKKASTLATDRGRIERHVKPLLGKKRVGEVTRADTLLHSGQWRREYCPDRVEPTPPPARRR
jgi:hypothetical protein